MLSLESLEQLKVWQLQLKETVAIQERRLGRLERRLLTTDTVPQRIAQSLASLNKAIVVCKNTLNHLEQASSQLVTLIDFYDRQVNDTSPPPPEGPTTSNHTGSPGAKRA